MQNQTFKLSLKPNDYPPNVPFVYADQYDEGRVFAATVYDADGSIYNFNGETVTIVGTKPSGTGFSYTATASGNTVTFETTGQMTVVAGNVTCGIIIEKDGDRIGTLHFVLHVQPAALSADTIIDSDDFGSIISDAVAEYLEEHGIVIDDTLSVAGAAADAAAVGDELDNLKSYFDEEVSPNVFNGNLTRGYINMAGAFTDSADYAHTDKIAVESTTFVITGSDPQSDRRMNIPVRFLTAYDINENVLSAYGQQQLGADYSFIDTYGANIITVDASVKYIVLSLYKPSEKFRDISISFDTTVTDYVPYGKTTTINGDVLPDTKYVLLQKFLTGKTVAVFGDSIMYGAGSDSKGPADLLAEKYDMTVAKYCVSGATMGVRTDNPDYTVDEAHHIAKQVRNAIADDVAPDIIIFNGGTNDIGGGITIGEMSTVYTQPATESYFADGFETVAYLLQTNFVGVPMIYMRAHNMSSRTYVGQIEYGELGNKIAEKWGIRTVDMYIRMNTQLADYRTAYLADYTHPNEAGYNKYYIPALEDFIFRELIS